MARFTSGLWHCFLKLPFFHFISKHENCSCFKDSYTSKWSFGIWGHLKEKERFPFKILSAMFAGAFIKRVCYEQCHVCKVMQPHIWLKWNCENLWKSVWWENILSCVVLETKELELELREWLWIWRAGSWNNHKGGNGTSQDERWEFQQKIGQDNEAGGRCLVTAAGFVASSLK